MRALSLFAAACFALVAMPALASVPVAAVPEPATLGLLGLGVVAVWASRRR